MHLIYNIDLVLALVRFEPSLLDEVTDVVDSSIGCCIYLDDIEHGRVIKSDTIRTCMTWIAITQVSTIDSLREDASAGCLTRSTRTMKEVCMPHTVVGECTTEDGLDAVLSDDRVPVSRAVLGVEAQCFAN
jgi:hypothetical protein